MSETPRNTIILLDSVDVSTKKRTNEPSKPQKAKRQRAPKRAGMIYHFKHDSNAKNLPVALENEVVNADAGGTTNKSNVATYTEVTQMQLDLQRIISRATKIDQRAKKLLPTELGKARQTHLNSTQKLVSALRNFDERFGGVIVKNTILTALEAVHWRTAPTSYIHSLAFNTFDVTRAEEVTRRLQKTPVAFQSSEPDVEDYRIALNEELSLVSDNATASEQLVSAQNALYLIYKRMLPSTPEVQKQLDTLRSLQSQLQSKFMKSPEIHNKRQPIIDPLSSVSIVPM